ncbi:universal stress protein [Foetidibacter luteolus]|uniref:universal stress protein n=1 Tax=Foetidibacter luteolus TaxID=2608880 RepID=UPI00129BD103|nr:universal stress protein [Foetidibacter luteolus]
MKTVICATDFSPAASNAANYAADLALALKASLVVLHIVSAPVSYSELPGASFAEEMEAEAEKELQSLKEALKTRTGGKVHISTLCRTGPFFDELDETCNEYQPYSVVMGSQGTTAAERFFFGGHTVNAIRHLDWPLITVPSQARFTGFKKIGLACDFKEVTDSIPANQVKQLVADFNAQLHVLNTGKQTEYDADAVFESALLQELIGKLTPQYHFITAGDVAEGIADFAVKNQIDLLIVFPKKHNLFEKIIHKSSSKQLVLHSPVPVMSMHD